MEFDDKQVQKAVREKVDESLRRGYIMAGLKSSDSGGEPRTTQLR